MKKLPFVLLIVSALTACVPEQQPNQQTFNVIPLEEIDALIMNNLTKANVIVEAGNDQLEIIDLEQARSEVSLAIYLNQLGQEGWQLTDINHGLLYIFSKKSEDDNLQPIQYKVIPPTEVDQQIMAELTKAGAVMLLPEGKYQVNDSKADPSAAFKAILENLQQDNWQLVASGANGIHIFSKPGVGRTTFKTLSQEEVDKIRKEKERAAKALAKQQKELEKEKNDNYQKQEQTKEAEQSEKTKKITNQARKKTDKIRNKL